MKIIVDKNLVERIEALQYEVESRKDIISQILANGFKTAGDAFEKYQSEYKEFFIQYNKAKQEMLDAYNIPNGAKWNLTFNNCELTVED
jgi:hypothetical protein